MKGNMSTMSRAIASGALFLLTAVVQAQPVPPSAFPSKPVRIIVPYSGGSSDVTARILAPKLQEVFRQPVIVENKPGANAVIGTDYVAKAPADGHTLLAVITTHVISPSLITTPYDPLRDFAAVTTFSAAELSFAIYPGVPANNLQELIALGKAKPGELNYATTQIGGNQHLAGELFAILTGAKFTAVPFKGGGEALGAVLGGHAQMYFGSLTSLIPPMKNGKLRAMAVSGDKRTPALPDVPTFTQAGVPNFDVRLWYGLLAPAATPKDVVERVNSVIANIINTPELKEALAKQGMDPLLMSPAQFGALMRTDFDRYAKIIKTANIKVDN